MKLLLFAVIAFFVAQLSACGDVQCDSDADCSAGQVCAEAGGVLFASRVCVAVDAPTISDMSDMSQPDMADGGTNDACVARSSQDICASLRAECGSPSVTECGVATEPNCGRCDDNEVCNTEFECECVPETDADFCSRFGADCGQITNLDNCGNERSVSCGTCANSDECGEFQANVCGCPCEIEGICYPANAVNPNNQCERCDPVAADEQWTTTVDSVCSDGDLCTENDTCNEAGECVGDAIVCEASSECRTSACDPQNGACFEEIIPDGQSCSMGRELFCLTSVCMTGQCMTNISGGSCFIDGVCYDSGQTNPNESCKVCRPFQSQTDWTPEGPGKRCDDQGLNCVEARCNDVGVCVFEIENGECLIDGVCYNDNEENPMNPCEECLPENALSDWSPVSAGTTCGGGVIGSCECDGAGVCIDGSASPCL